MNILNIISNYGKMVKFSHTLFALPFAGLSVILALLESKLNISDFYYKLLLNLIETKSSFFFLKAKVATLT